MISIRRSISIKKFGVELEPIPFAELPSHVQEWLNLEEYVEMGTSLPSDQEMHPPVRRGASCVRNVIDP